MKNHLMKLTLLLLVPALFFGCKKSKNDTPKTKTDLITQASWKFDNATVGGFDVSSFLQTCQKDNTITLAANGSGVVDEGATKCNASDPQTVNFSWNFASNETVLHVSTILFTGGSSDFNIVTLTETQLVVSQNITVSGTTQNAVVTFKH